MQLDEFHTRLLGEHGRAVQRLEAKVVALEGLNNRMRRQVSDAFGVVHADSEASSTDRVTEVSLFAAVQPSAPRATRARSKSNASVPSHSKASLSLAVKPQSLGELPYLVPTGASGSEHSATARVGKARSLTTASRSSSADSRSRSGDRHGQLLPGQPQSPSSRSGSLSARPAAEASAPAPAGGDELLLGLPRPPPPVLGTPGSSSCSSAMPAAEVESPQPGPALPPVTVSERVPRPSTPQGSAARFNFRMIKEEEVTEAQAEEPRAQSEDSEAPLTPIRDEAEEQENDEEGDELESRRSLTIGGAFQVLNAWEAARARHQGQDSKSRTMARSATTGPNRTFGDMEEQEGNKQSRLDTLLQRFVVHPASVKRLIWEMLIVLFVLYDIGTVPLFVFHPPDTSFILTARWVTRIFWTLDIPFSCVCGYHDSQVMTELSPTMAALRYIKTRLPFDILVVGCDWIGEGFADSINIHSINYSSQLLGLLQAVKPLGLVRLTKTRNVLDFVLEQLRSEGKLIAASSVGMVFVLIVAIHLLACIWYGVLTSEWGCDAPGTLLPILDPNMNTVEEKYMFSFHFILGLFSGDVVAEPNTLHQRFFMAIVLLMSFVSSAIFVGLLTTAMTRLQVIASQRSAQFAALNRYLSDCGISRRLAIRVQRNARHALKQGERNTPESKVELLQIISEPLRSEIHFEVHSPLLMKHPFFWIYSRVNPAAVRRLCHSAVADVSLSRGDVLFSELEVPVKSNMFFVMDGKLVYSTGLFDQQNVEYGQWLSEAALWTLWAHRGSLQARSECRLLALDAQRFVNIATTYPESHVQVYAEHFVNSLNQDASDAFGLNDVGQDGPSIRSLVSSAFTEVDPNIELPAEWVPPRRSSIRGSLGGRRSCASVDSMEWEPDQGVTFITGVVDAVRSRISSRFSIFRRW